MPGAGAAAINRARIANDVRKCTNLKLLRIVASL
jgi:hypothetical protein